MPYGMSGVGAAIRKKTSARRPGKSAATGIAKASKGIAASMKSRAAAMKKKASSVKSAPGGMNISKYKSNLAASGLGMSTPYKKKSTVGQPARKVGSYVGKLGGAMGSKPERGIGSKPAPRGGYKPGGVGAVGKPISNWSSAKRPISGAMTRGIRKK